MTERVMFVVPGPPHGKRRPRVTMRGRSMARALTQTWRGEKVVGGP